MTQIDRGVETDSEAEGEAGSAAKSEVKSAIDEIHKDFLYVKRMGIDTHQEPVVYMRKDCHVCRSEGFDAHSRVRITTSTGSIIATVSVVTNDSLSHQEIGLSESAWKRMNSQEGDKANLRHARPADSMSAVRAKMYGVSFTEESALEVVNDIVRGSYSDIELAAFVSACAGNRLNTEEITALTHAMVGAGERLHWKEAIVLDKHCVGGLPGNRTTPIVVSIVVAAGLTMPKTSSRAITSPAGTADTMETLTNVHLTIDEMQHVVETVGGCIAWGGSVSLSPADDVLIRVERGLDIDSEGQLVASVISKKVAAGSTHVLIDIPVGPTAKVRSEEYAKKLSQQLIETGGALGLVVETVFTDGLQPVGNGIGPALEARDILQVLKNDTQAPQDLRQRSLILAGKLLEIGGRAERNEGYVEAEALLNSSAAFNSFVDICEAQGGLKIPPVARYQHPIVSEGNGIVSYINNRLISKLAKLAGAPVDQAAGVDFHVRLGSKIRVGELLFTIHAESPGELNYALDFLKNHDVGIKIEGESL
ncbi:MAG: thymidine phosphorylase family protein [Pseudomonadales bacterium]|nr:thymidine phosphorylase family protein [Pseudomonadales bacterium]